MVCLIRLSMVGLDYVWLSLHSSSFQSFYVGLVCKVHLSICFMGALQEEVACLGHPPTYAPYKIKASS